MFSISLSPLHYLIRKLQNKNISINAKAFKSWEISPSTSARVFPPVFIPGDMENIIAYNSFTNKEREKNRLFSKSIEYPATSMIELKNATIVDWNIYHKGNRQWQHIEAKYKPIYFGEFDRFHTSIICCNPHRNRFFGHWLTDQMTTEMLASEGYGETISCIPKADYIHEGEYRRLAGIHTTKIKRAKIKNLFIPFDVAHNNFRQERFRKLRNLISNSIEHTQKKHYPLVFIGRGNSGSERDLLNQSEIEAWVKNNGGVIVEPEKSSVIEMYHIFSNAKCIIGLEGSSLTHALMLMKEESTLVTIQEPNRFESILKTYCDVINVNYGFIISELTSKGLMLPISKLNKLFDLIT